MKFTDEDKTDIRAAIDAHVAAGRTVTEPFELFDRICLALGDEGDMFEYAGWQCVRCTGWIATHIETGHKEEFPPECSDTTPAMVKLQLDTKNEWKEKLGHWPWERKKIAAALGVSTKDL